MRTPSSVVNGSRPVTRAISSAPTATANAAAYGTLRRGGRLPTAPRNLGQDLGKRHVFAAENIALTDPPGFGRCEMTGGDVVDMHDIEPGVDKAWHMAARGFEDQPPGRRRLEVARADRRRRIDDDRGQAALADQTGERPPRPGISTACKARSCRRAGSASLRRPSRREPDRSSRRCWYGRCARHRRRAPRSSGRGCRRHWRGTSPPGREPTADNRRRHGTDTGSRRPRGSRDGASSIAPSAISTDRSARLRRSPPGRASTRTR